MKYRVKHDGVTKTYAVLQHTAWHLLESAKAREEGAMLNLQAAAVFYAFAFEAYLNHVGQEEIQIWDEIERVSHANKLRIIAKQLKLKVDLGRPPFKMVRDLFNFRDMLAHGRTKKIDVQYEADEEPHHLSSWRIHDWEKLTIQKVQVYASSVREAVETINHSRPVPDEMVWNQGMRGRSVELIADAGRTSACNTTTRKPCRD
ncbi:MAG: hypothetical protein WC299_06780 [Kiritimatiellia bacterium]